MWLSSNKVNVVFLSNILINKYIAIAKRVWINKIICLKKPIMKADKASFLGPYCTDDTPFLRASFLQIGLVEP